MPIPSPFHERTAPLCHSMLWKQWGGYYAVRSFDTCHEREYLAFRHAVGMIDVTPLFKYDVTGADAEAFLSRVTVKDVSKLKPGRVTYTCWCDDEGKVVDDGTITNFGNGSYRVTAAEPSYSWFTRYTRGLDVEIRDVSEEIGALAVQGPNSRELLRNATDIQMDDVKFFAMAQGKLEGIDATITRTGYTGDLGYEVWVPASQACQAWDALMNHGKKFGIEPCGLDALDLTRVEAGFIMNGVDYFSAHHCMIESRKSTPYELGLGWTINLNRDPFNGQRALMKEKETGPAWNFVGLDLDWNELEAHFNALNLPPGVPHGAWRDGIPIYDLSMHQVGFANSGAWSPTLKKNLALAHVKSGFGKTGTKLKFEITVEYQRKHITATVTDLPFFNPERKRS